MRITIIIIVFAFSTIVKAQQNSFSETLDSLLQDENKHGTFSGTVIIAENDKIVYSGSDGFADMERQVPNDSITRFNIASVGKLFTQIVILQLLQEGKLKLTDTIGKYFNGFNQPNAEKITILSLLNHTSGLGDFFTNREYLNLSDYTSQEDVIKIIAREKPSFVPGTEFDYSNSGYYLLGAIASKVDNKNLENVMHDRIFGLLQLNNTTFIKTGDVIPHQALPYKMKWNKIKPGNNEIGGDITTGAGGEFSTTFDLYKVFNSIVNDNVLLNDSTKALIFNHYNPESWDNIIKSGKLYGQVGGDTKGWSAKITFMFNKNKTCGTIILANFDNMAHELDLKLRPIIKRYSK